VRITRWLFAASITWFLFDFAYYGDTIPSDSIVSKVAKHATPLRTSAIELAIFAIFSLPAFYIAAFTIDRIGRRRLHIIGFVGVALFFCPCRGYPGRGYHHRALPPAPDSTDDSPARRLTHRAAGIHARTRPTLRVCRSRRARRP